MNKHHVFFVALGILGIFVSSQSHSEDLSRGKMLYENNCLECHESKIHIREQRKVKSLENLHDQIIRWSNELHLAWKHEEIRDVSGYLNRVFYKFDNDN